VRSAIEKGMRANPDERHDSMRVLLDVLRRDRGRRKRISMYLVIAMVLVVACAILAVKQCSKHGTPSMAEPSSVPSPS
jgi:hypothetical protein